MKKLLTLTIALLLVSAPSLAEAVTWTSHVQAWIYPGSPACNAATEYSDGRVIDTLKPEYYTVNTSGVISTTTVAISGCNGYTVANATDVKAHSTHQYITVSNGAAGMAALTADSGLSTTAINTMVAGTQITGFTGIELDWEGYGAWTTTSYANYKTFVDSLGAALHAVGKKLTIDGPPICHLSDGECGQNLYKYKYEDFNADTNVDYLADLVYDYEFDFAIGTDVPVSPDFWATNAVNWIFSKITDHSRVIIGMPSYGYHGTTGGFNVTIDTFAQSSALTGFSGAAVGTSSEFVWQNAGSTFWYQATSSMEQQRTMLEALGVQNTSVWHLGGNNWFSASNVEPGSTGSPTAHALFGSGVTIQFASQGFLKF